MTAITTLTRNLGTIVNNGHFRGWYVWEIYNWIASFPDYEECPVLQEFSCELDKIFTNFKAPRTYFLSWCNDVVKNIWRSDQNGVEYKCGVQDLGVLGAIYLKFTALIEAERLREHSDISEQKLPTQKKL